MTVNRGGRPVIHGSRWLAVRLEQNRIEPRIRRLIARLQRELTATPFGTLRALIVGRLARRELLMQQREAHLLADPSGDGGKWLVALWNAQRRDTELLALLDKLPDPDNLPPSLDEYLKARATAPPASAPA